MTGLREKITMRRHYSEHTPYLGLRSRLSQVWFNCWSILLLLIFVRVMLSTTGLNSDLDSARGEALSSCTGVESMGSAMASMPHYLSKGVNEMAASGIEASVRALQKMVLLLITGVQEIVIFVVHIMTSTYLCLIMLAINGSVGAVVDASKAIIDGVNKATKEIHDSLSDGIEDFESAFKKVTEKLVSIPNFFGGNFDIPELDLPDLDKLEKIQIPNRISEKLTEMKENVPDFKDVQQAADDAIRIPFKLLRDTVNASLGIYEFNRDVFPVPAKEKLTFCSDNPAINNFFDGLIDTITITKKVVIGVVLAAVFLVMIPMAYIEYRSHKSTQERARNLVHISHGRDDPAFFIDCSNVIGRPYPTALGLRLSERYRESKPNRAVLIRWAVSYVTSPPVLFAVSLGIAGLLGVLAQYVVLLKVEAETPKLAAEVGGFAGLVVEKLQGASENWALSTNQAIKETNDELNEELFGWVTEGTKSLNDTLNTFVDKMSEGIDKLFGGTPLEKPIEDVLDCLVTLKIQGIQKGLTWANENAHITFPLLANDTFSVGASDSILPQSESAESFLADPDSKATDKITNAVVKLTAKWRDMLLEEAIISLCILGIWFICAIIALTRLALNWFSNETPRGVGGPAAYASGADMDLDRKTSYRGRPRSQDDNSTIFSDNNPFDEYQMSKVKVGMGPRSQSRRGSEGFYSYK